MSDPWQVVPSRGEGIASPAPSDLPPDSVMAEGARSELLHAWKWLTTRHDHCETATDERINIGRLLDHRFARASITVQPDDSGRFLRAFGQGGVILTTLYAAGRIWHATYRI